MESLKSLYRSMSDMSKMLIKILLGIICGLFVILLLIFALRIIRGAKKSYDSLENTMQNAAINYYKKHTEELPEEEEEAIVSIDKLVEEEYMKELSKYVSKNTQCTGNVTVIKNGDNYAYLPYLDCNKEYKTKILSEEILANNEIVESSSGLYLDENNNYLFRGEYVNNYITFANLTWRILRVNEDGTIRLLLVNPIKEYKKTKWDDRYNIDKESNVGINDFAVSRIKEKLEQIYNDDTIFSENQKALITKQDLCVGSRTKDSDDFSGTEECSEIIEDQYLGLLQVNEYLAPSIDENCSSTLDHSCLNYNYLTSLTDSFWTQTPLDNSYEVYRISKALYVNKTSSNSNILFTLNLSNKTQIKSGNGTLKDPYVVKDYQKK